MSRTIPAIYDAGVFRPLEPVELADGTRVEVQVVAASATDEVDDATRKSWCEYLDRMEALPDAPSPDGLTNRDHDRIIYGG